MPPTEEPPLIRRCAWCQRRYREGEWIVDLEPISPEGTTATICPRCANELHEQTPGGEPNAAEPSCCNS